MATFPSLQSGAVCQYPTRIGETQMIEVLRFLDGNSQRFPKQGRQFKVWKIQLDLLSDLELRKLEQFFTSLGANYSSFDFPDPLTGLTIFNCRFAESQLVSDFLGTNVNSATVLVVETNG